MVSTDTIQDTFNNNSCEDEIQESYEPGPSNAAQDMSVSHKRLKKTGTPGFFSHDILKLPAIVSTAIRNKITPTALSAITASIIKAAGGDTDKVFLNYATAYW